MRHPNSGLYFYCLNVGKHINALIEEQGGDPARMYVPPAEKKTFESRHVIVERKWHRLWRPFLRNCRVWHAPFQSGRILPDPGRNPDTRVVLTIHDLNALHEGQPEDIQQRSVAHTQSLIDRSDAIVCISDFVKQDVLRNCNTGNKPLYVIYNGANQLAAPLLSYNSYRTGRPFLFGMGYINTKKNYHVLLSLLKQNEQLELILAGRLDEPEYIESMKRQAEEWNIGDRLKLLGAVSEAEKAWYINACTAFVHPSLAEGFGAPVIEAMSFGKPVFLSDRTALPEIGGEAAFYFSSFEPDHMQEVFLKGIQRYGSDGMRELIRMRSQEFCWKKSAREYLQVYQSLY